MMVLFAMFYAQPPYPTVNDWLRRWLELASFSLHLFLSEHPFRPGNKDCAPLVTGKVGRPGGAGGQDREMPEVCVLLSTGLENKKIKRRIADPISVPSIERGSILVINNAVFFLHLSL